MLLFWILTKLRFFLVLIPINICSSSSVIQVALFRIQMKLSTEKQIKTKQTNKINKQTNKNKNKNKNNNNKNKTKQNQTIDNIWKFEVNMYV